jgi:two-component system OmpR family sensor kinase
LNGLVNQLLKLARLRNVSVDKLAPTSADDILKQTVASLYPLAENKNIDLGVTESSAIQLNDFNGGLSQLFENAIANAIYYTPEGGQVDVSLTVNNGYATFQVTDTGPGIDPTQLENVFTPFYRITGNNDSGSGLGLAICNEIAQQLNGKISLANRKEGGLNFSYIQKSI